MRTPLVQLSVDLLAKFLNNYLEKHPEAENRASVQKLMSRSGLPEGGSSPAKKKYRRYK